MQIDETRAQYKLMHAEVEERETESVALKVQVGLPGHYAPWHGRQTRLMFIDFYMADTQSCRIFLGWKWAWNVLVVIPHLDCRDSWRG